MRPEKAWEWNAEDYARNSAAQLEWAAELLPKLKLRRNDVVLDIGCGDGKITALLAQIAVEGRVVGIDLSAEMIRHAAETFSPEAYPNMAFVRMDAAQIDFGGRESFDVAFSNAALHWVEDHGAVLRGVRACLRKKGRLLFQMGGEGNAAGMWAVVDEITGRPAWRAFFRSFPRPYHFYRPEKYDGWLEETRFRKIRADLIPKDMRHKGKEGLTGWLRTTWFPYTDRLPGELRETFLSEVAEAYLAAYPLDAHGCAHVDMVRLEVEAVAEE